MFNVYCERFDPFSVSKATINYSVSSSINVEWRVPGNDGFGTASILSLLCSSRMAEDVDDRRVAFSEMKVTRMPMVSCRIFLM